MPDLFVSYARTDETFGRKLHARLTGIKRDVWMDWEDIPFNADWWEEIQRGIEISDNFLVVLSNDFVTSPVCMLEVDYARRNNKRILVVAHDYEEAPDVNDRLIQRTEDSDTVRGLLGDRDILTISRENWTTIGHVNWLFFNSNEDFDKNFHNLIETLDTDLNHVRTHTTLQVAALDWVNNDRDWSFLLSGVLIDQAEEWLKDADAHDKAPRPTDIQHDLIAASRQQQIEQENSIQEMQNRAQRFRRASMIAGGFAAFMVIIAIGLTLFTTSRVLDSRERLEEANLGLALADSRATSAQETLADIPPTFTAVQAEINANNTEVAAAEQTLTPIVETLAGAEIARIEAESARQTAEGQVNEAQTVVFNANSQLDVANAALTPAALALTQSADERATSQADAAIAYADATQAQVQLVTANERAAEAEALQLTVNAELSDANATFEVIVPTLTKSSNEIAQANDFSTQSARELGTASFQVTDANTRLTEIAPRIANAETQVVEVETQVAEAEIQVAEAANQVATANAQSQASAREAEDNRIEAELNQIQAQSQSLIVNAEQVRENGDIDLALALAVESYTLNPNLPQTRRLMNQLAYTSARFIFPNATFVIFDNDSTMVAYGLGKETIILDIENREEIARLTGHNDTVIAGDFNADDTLLVTGSLDSTIIVWDTSTWEPIRTLDNHEAPITDVTFDNRGSQIGAVADDDMVFIWDVLDDYAVTSYDFENDDVTLNRIEFYADGARFLAWGLDSTQPVQYRVNMNSILPPSRFFDQIYTVLNPAVNRRAGQVIDSAMIESEPFLTVYNLLNSELDASFTTGFRWTEGQDVAGVRAFNSNGSEIVVAISNGLTDSDDIYILSTARRERESGLDFDGPAERNVTALAFSPDGRTVLSGFGRYLVLWDTDTGRELRRFGAHLDEIVSIDYSVNSDYAITQSRDGNYRVWDVNFSDPAVLNRLRVSADPLHPGLSPDGTEVYFNVALDISGYDVEDGERIRDSFSVSRLNHIIYDQTSGLIVTTQRNSPNNIPQVNMWDLSSNEQFPIVWRNPISAGIDGQIDPVGAFSPDGRQIALSINNTVRVYDITEPASPELTYELTPTRFDSAIGAVVFSPEGRYLYIATNQIDGVENYALITWDLEDDSIDLVALPHNRPIRHMDLNEDGSQILTGSEDNSIILFSLETNTLLRRLIGHRAAITGIYFGLDDEVALSSSDDGTMNLWDLDTGQSVREYVLGSSITGLYLSNDGRTAATTDKTRFVTTWDIETIDDVIEWIEENREVPDFSDEECAQYNIKDCD